MKKQEEISFRLCGNNLNVREMRASDVAKMQLDFIKQLEKLDKTMKFIGFKEGSAELNALTNFDYGENESKVRDTLLYFFQTNKEKVEYVNVLKGGTILYCIKSKFLEDPIIIISSGDYLGEITDIGGVKEVNVHINIKEFNNRSIKFPITKKQAKEWRKYLYEDVEIYAEIEHDLDLKEAPKGIKIIELNPIEELDAKKVNKDFADLVKKINDPDFTSTILNIRHED